MTFRKSRVLNETKRDSHVDLRLLLAQPSVGSFGHSHIFVSLYNIILHTQQPSQLRDASDSK